MKSLRPRPVIALTPTTRVRHFRLHERSPWRVAIWRAGRLVATLFALALTACGNPRLSATVHAEDPRWAAAAAQAVALWNEADPAFALTYTDDAQADVLVRTGTLSAYQCAEAALGTPYITVSPAMGPHCAANVSAVLAHELGHWMAWRTDHLGDGHVMAADANAIVAKPTPGDVAYVLE